MRRNEFSICCTPASLPLVQTLVARNALAWAFDSASRSPTTCSDEPYMGEESIVLPPASNRTRRTSLNGLRAAASAPTSKVCQVPRPTIGNSSPVFGIGLRRIA